MDDVIDEVERLLQQLQDKVEWLRDRINEVLSSVPGWLDWVADRVTEAWNAFVDKLGELWAWFTHWLAGAGDPIGLSHAAEDWISQVSTPLGAQSQQVDDGDLLVDDRWTGDAAEQYRQKVPEQNAALDAIRSELVSGITAALDAMKMGIIVFWGGVVVALVAVIGGLAGAAGATGTIVGLPAAPVIAGVAVAAALVSLGVGVATLLGEASSAEHSIQASASYGLTTWPSFAVS